MYIYICVYHHSLFAEILVTGWIQIVNSSTPAVASEAGDLGDERFGELGTAETEQRASQEAAVLHDLTGAFYVGNGWVAGGCWDDYY